MEAESTIGKSPFLENIKQCFLDLLFNKNQSENKTSQISRTQFYIEIFILCFFVTIYCLGFLDFSTTKMLPGSESNLFQTYDKMYEVSIKEYGEFPMWNPYYRFGIPYIADPMVHIFNPIITIPVLTLGVLNGFKFAVYLSFILSALGMWWFAKTLNLNVYSRFWMALMYVFAGPPVAKFVQGHYLFTIGYAFMIWAIASIYAVYKYKSLKFVVLAIFSLALLYFSGNMYYPFYTVCTIILFSVIFLITKKEKQVNIDYKFLVLLIIIGFLSLGVISVQLIPSLELHKWISKDPLLSSHAHNMYQIWLDLTCKSPYREDIKSLLMPEEYYAYIGPWIFLFLPGIFWVWKKGIHRRLIIFFTALIIISVSWINYAFFPWKDMVYQLKFLTQFRYPTRVLPFIIIALIGLAGLSIDFLVKKISELLSNYTDKKIIKTLLYVSQVGLILFLLFTVYDVYEPNHRFTQTTTDNMRYYEIAKWIKENNAGVFNVATADTGWHMQMINNEIIYFDVWYPFTFHADLQGATASRPVVPTANFRINDINNPPPEENILIKTFNNTGIYKMTDSLPIAFLVPTETLLEVSPEWIRVDEVQKLEDVELTYGSITIEATSNTNDMMVIQQYYYPGWKLTVDGKSQPIINIYGFLATKVHEGTHEYVFIFRPFSFYFGLVVSIISLILVLIILYWANHYKLPDGLKNISQFRLSSNRQPRKPKIKQQMTSINTEEVISTPTIQHISHEISSSSIETPVDNNTDQNPTLTIQTSQPNTMHLSIKLPPGSKLTLDIESTQQTNKKKKRRFWK